MEGWLQPSLRFAHYALLLGLFGLTAFRAGWLRPPLTDDDRIVTGFALQVTAALAPIISSVLTLVGIAAMMGTGVRSLDLAMVREMILETSIGWASLFRVMLLLMTAAIIVLQPRSNARWWVVAALYGAALATLAWEGHAAASDGTVGAMHRINDAVHLLAAGLWIGAIGWFLALAVMAHRQGNAHSAMPLIAALHRFQPLGIALVAIVAITGTINAQMIFGIDQIPVLITTPYGQLLAIKLVTFGLMLICAARNSMVSKGAVADPKHGAAHGLSVLRHSLVIEAGLALTIIALIALIGLTSPMG